MKNRGAGSLLSQKKPARGGAQREKVTLNNYASKRRARVVARRAGQQVQLKGRYVTKENDGLAKRNKCVSADDAPTSGLRSQRGTG